jgi:hypothetical protein
VNCGFFSLCALCINGCVFLMLWRLLRGVWGCFWVVAPLNPWEWLLFSTTARLSESSATRQRAGGSATTSETPSSSLSFLKCRDPAYLGLRVHTIDQAKFSPGTRHRACQSLPLAFRDLGWMLRISGVNVFWHFSTGLSRPRRRSSERLWGR